MRRVLAILLVLGGCAGEAPPRLAAPLPPPEPIPVAAPVIEPGVLPPGWYVPDPPAAPEEPVAPPPAPDPEARLASLLRQNPWLVRFWSELTPAEQSRVTRALSRGGQAGPAPAAWDPMGLRDRVELMFGPLRAAG